MDKEWQKVDINKQYISENNTYTGKNKPKYIIIHETDNKENGAGAQRHAKAQYLGNLETSVHYYCGADGVYQAARHADGTYSIGREYSKKHPVQDATNRNTINVEICVNADGDYNTAYANAVGIVAYLLQETGIPAERVIRHYDATGKYCPRRMMDSPALWNNFLQQIKEKAASANAAASQPAQNNNFSQHIKDLQWALNADGITDASGNRLAEDGIWGKNTEYAVRKILLSTNTLHKYRNVTSWVQYRVGVKVDGLFGKDTKAAVIKFQKSQGLSADGIVGEDTMLALVRMYYSVG